MSLAAMGIEDHEDAEGARVVKPGALLDNYEELAAKLMQDSLQRDRAEQQAAGMLGFADADALFLAVMGQWKTTVQALPRVTPLGNSLAQYAEVFLRSPWPIRALRVGWGELDLFAIDPTHPNRLDAQGLVPSVALSTFRLKIATLTADTVVLRTESDAGLRHGRGLYSATAVPLWECTAAFPRRREEQRHESCWHDLWRISSSQRNTFEFGTLPQRSSDLEIAVGDDQRSATRAAARRGKLISSAHSVPSVLNNAVAMFQCG